MSRPRARSGSVVRLRPGALGSLAALGAFALAALAPACAHRCPDPLTGGAPRASAYGASNATGAAAAPSPSSDDMTSAAATLDRFHAAAAAANEEAYFALFADGGVFLGTDATERWTVPQFRAYAHPRFASGKAWAFRSSRRDVTVRGDVAWFDEELETKNLGPARGSGVLLRDGRGEWKVAQYNLSIPIPNERFGEVKKLIEREPR